MRDDERVQAGERLVERVVGVSVPRMMFTDDHGTWDPVVPPDLHLAKLPPVAEDGTVECRRCRSRVPFERVNIADQSYVCNACTVVHAAPVDDVKLGRGGPSLLLVAVGVLVLAGVVVLAFW